MNTKFYVDGAGKFIGSFVGAEPPEGAIEVPYPPECVTQTWLGTEYGPVPEVFAPLSPWQVRQVLNIKGVRQDVENFIAVAPIEVRDAWQFASSFERYNDLIVAAGLNLSWSKEFIDELFRDGALLKPVTVTQ